MSQAQMLRLHFCYRLNQMASKQLTSESETIVQTKEPPGRWVGWTSLVFAFLQSVCAFVFATSGIRVLIGLSALAAAAGTDAPPKGFHQDAIRIPMMLLALAGTLFNLYAVWRVRSLRKRPASQWRVQPVTKRKLRSEWLQIALSVVTLILLVAEWLTHPLMHHPH